MTETLNPLLPYQQTANEVVAGLGSHGLRGLNNQEAQARLGRYGPNELVAEPPIPAWRLCFERLADYEHYARSVVAAEQNQVSRPRRLTFFGATNPDDRATDLSTRHLIQPLYANLKANQGVAESNLPSWEVNLVQGEAATHARLEALLGGEETPALLFTAGHGMEFLANDTRQVPHQGALLCQDWPTTGQHVRSLDYRPDWFSAGSGQQLIGCC